MHIDIRIDIDYKLEGWKKTEKNRFIHSIKLENYFGPMQIKFLFIPVL